MLLCRRSLLFAGAVTPLMGSAPALAAPDIRFELGGLARLVGKWRGEGDGQPGHSIVERCYEPQLGGLFLCARNTSSYAPQERNPKGEVHHDIGYYSFDKGQKRARFRQFHSEGFVAHYVATTESLDSAEVVFESEFLENIPGGYRSRETYRFIGSNRFEEIFEIAEPGKAYEIYSHNRLTKA